MLIFASLNASAGVGLYDTLNNAGRMLPRERNVQKFKSRFWLIGV
jgi:hypothetical protein